MDTKLKAGLAAVAVVTLGAVAAGGAAIAAGGDGATRGYGYAGFGGHGPGGPGGPGGADHEHTEVTGAEATKVEDAVTAEHDDVTVESVRQDPDGSYDVMATRAGEPVFFEVSADLATVTERTGGPGGPGRGGPGGPGGHEHTEVTGAEATKVEDAVIAEHGDVTVESVRQDPDGSYDVMATRDSEPVFFEVSADLATVTERTGGPGGGHGSPGGPRDHDREAPATEAPTPG